MRVTCKDLEFYVNRINARTNNHIALGHHNGMYWLYYDFSGNTVCPYGMSARECYYVLLSLFDYVCLIGGNDE